jgi:hypothetical protein
VEYAEGETWVRRHESAEVVHIRLREPMGAMAPFCGPVGLNFQADKVPKV